MNGGARHNHGRQVAAWVWPWLGRSAVVLGAALLVLAVLVLVARSAAVFWPAPVSEWVIDADSGDSRRLFAQQVGQARRFDGAAPNQADGRRYLVRLASADSPAHRWIGAGRVLRRSQPAHLVTVTTVGGDRVHGYVQGIKLAVDQQSAAIPMISMAAGAQLVLTLADRSERRIPLVDIAGLEYLNQRSLAQRARFAGAAIFEFIAGGETDAGAAAALYGTARLALLMLGMLIPPGLLCALYLHCYGRGAPAATVRLAVTSLASVPSAVIGVFVLGCLVYTVDAGVGSWSFGALSSRSGNGKLIWPALALALLSLPVMIAITDAGLRAVPEHERRSAMALGATRRQIISSLLLPRAVPAIAAGALLAVARSAGAVAPLLVVGGAVDSPPVGATGAADSAWGGDSFDHVGLRVYALAVAGRDAYPVAAQACATALLLLLVVWVLNALAARCLRGVPGDKR